MFKLWNKVLNQLSSIRAKKARQLYVKTKLEQYFTQRTFEELQIQFE